MLSSCNYIGCGRTLQSNTAKPNDGQPYCNACFTKNFTYLKDGVSTSISGGGGGDTNSAS